MELFGEGWSPTSRAPDLPHSSHGPAGPSLKTLALQPSHFKFGPVDLLLLS